jgi:hypothetical protein
MIVFNKVKRIMLELFKQRSQILANNGIAILLFLFLKENNIPIK